MRLTTLLPLLLVGALANPVPAPDADPDAMAMAAPDPNAELNILESRATGTGYNPSSCPGSQLAGSRGSGTVFGGLLRWRMYYSSANGGTNCLVVDNTSGKPLSMWASIEMGKNSAGDSGLYHAYAGPVAVRGTKGTCVSISLGYQVPSGTTVYPQTFTKSGWCGR